MIMKLSEHTTSVLKNFATINQNLVIKEGSELLTMSAMKNIVAKADVEETFPKEFAIYDLNEFLAALSIFAVPILEFEDQYLIIKEEGQPDKKLKYLISPNIPPSASYIPISLVIPATIIFILYCINCFSQCSSAVLKVIMHYLS